VRTLQRKEAFSWDEGLQENGNGSTRKKGKNGMPIAVAIVCDSVNAARQIVVAIQHEKSHHKIASREVARGCNNRRPDALKLTTVRNLAARCLVLLKS